MLATVEFGSDKLYDQGFNLNNLEEETLIFESGKRMDGDDGSSF